MAASFVLSIVCDTRTPIFENVKESNMVASIFTEVGKNIRRFTSERPVDSKWILHSIRRMEHEIKLASGF